MMVDPCVMARDRSFAKKTVAVAKANGKTASARAHQATIFETATAVLIIAFDLVVSLSSLFSTLAHIVSSMQVLFTLTNP